MGVEPLQYSLPPELDTYIQESIFHKLGFCTHENQLRKRLAKAEESQRDLALQLQRLQFCLRESDHKRSKLKEEALLNAQGLKKQVAENQKVMEQCRALKDECSRLEQECTLYHNDRDVFMEAAYEAEDRAADADDRAVEAEASNAHLRAQLDQMREALEKYSCRDAEVNSGEDLASLKARIFELEHQNASLQEELLRIKSLDTLDIESRATKGVIRGDEISYKEYEETRDELRKLQELHASEMVSRRDEKVVQSMVNSAITLGVSSALEEETRAEISDLNSHYSEMLRTAETECNELRERAKFAEKNVQNLLLELQAVRQEAAIFRNNLDKAEEEVQVLADENKEVRMLLRHRFPGLDSPVPNKGTSIGGSSKSRGRRPKPYDPVNDEHICEMCKARQPLMPLQANSVDRKAGRGQSLLN